MIQKSKFLTFVLSFFVPGLGHLYLGLNRRGLTFMATFFGCIAFAWVLTLLAPFAIAIVWFYALFDALQQATMVNLRLAGHMPPGNAWGSPPAGSPKETVSDLDQIPNPFSSSPGTPPRVAMWVGIVFVALGVIAIVRIVFPSFWFWLAGVHLVGVLLALLLIGFGVWLIRTNWRHR